MNHMLAYKYFVLIRRTSIFICVLNILSSYSWLIIFVFRCFCKQMCWGTLMSMLLVDPFSCLFSRNYSGMLQHTIAFASSYIFPLYYIVSRSYLVYNTVYNVYALKIFAVCNSYNIFLCWVLFLIHVHVNIAVCLCVFHILFV